MSVDINEAAKFATEISQEAVAIIWKAYENGVDVREKISRSDLVTETDLAVETFLVERISKKYPDHRFLCEELANSEMLTPNPTWIIDPIDGTTNFIHKHPCCAVSIALVIDNKSVVGVVNLPFASEIFTAVAGEGAYLNGRKIQVGPLRSLEQAVISTGFLVGIINSASDICAEGIKIEELRGVIKRNFQNVMGKCNDIRRIGATSVDLCYVACGRCDAYFEIGPWEWDVAAGILIVEEAGGYISNFDGNPMKLSDRHVLAASSKELGQALCYELESVPAFRSSHSD